MKIFPQSFFENNHVRFTATIAAALLVGYAVQSFVSYSDAKRVANGREDMIKNVVAQAPEHLKVFDVSTIRCEPIRQGKSSPVNVDCFANDHAGRQVRIRERDLIEMASYRTDR